MAEGRTGGWGKERGEGRREKEWAVKKEIRGGGRKKTRMEKRKDGTTEGGAEGNPDKRDRDAQTRRHREKGRNKRQEHI